jgi:hypothetical protein
VLAAEAMVRLAEVVGCGAAFVWWVVWWWQVASKRDMMCVGVRRCALHGRHTITPRSVVSAFISSKVIHHLNISS